MERLPAGLLVRSGDVVLTFDAQALDWTRRGVCCVAMLQPAESGTRHGVYVTDEHGRVSVAELPAARRPAVCRSRGARYRCCVFIRIRHASLGADRRRVARHQSYEHVTRALTGQWKPASSDPPALHAFFDAVKRPAVLVFHVIRRVHARGHHWSDQVMRLEQLMATGGRCCTVIACSSRPLVPSAGRARSEGLRVVLVVKGRRIPRVEVPGQRTLP